VAKNRPTLRLSCLCDAPKFAKARRESVAANDALPLVKGFPLIGHHRGGEKELGLFGGFIDVCQAAHVIVVPMRCHNRLDWGWAHPEVIQVREGGTRAFLIGQAVDLMNCKCFAEAAAENRNLDFPLRWHFTHSADPQRQGLESWFQGLAATAFGNECANLASLSRSPYGDIRPPNGISRRPLIVDGPVPECL
jgi:hypothetical protein